MKFIYILIALISTITLRAQDNPERIEAKELFTRIQKGGKPAVVQFWVPNCKSKEEIVQSYKELVEKHSDKIDFYFVGITNLPSLIIELDKKLNFEYPFYYLGGNKEKDLMERKTEFASTLIELFNQGTKKDFITLYIKNSDNIYYDESIEVDMSKILDL